MVCICTWWLCNNDIKQCWCPLRGLQWHHLFAFWFLLYFLPFFSPLLLPSPFTLIFEIVHFLLSIIHITFFFVNLQCDFLWKWQHIARCNHNPMGQKSCQITKKNSQNWINIYVLPFKAMTIMASYFFPIYMDVKEFKPNPFDDFFV